MTEKNTKEKIYYNFIFCSKVTIVPYCRGGDNRAVTELGFAHDTTKTWAYLGKFGFFRNFLVTNLAPPPKKKKITFLK